MSTKELLDAIDEKLNRLSNEQMMEVLKFLEDMVGAPATRFDINSELEQVIKEDFKLLQRLAK